MSSASRPHSGAYNFRCLQCCARLVVSTHPDKHQAKVMLAAIARFERAPAREDVLACVRQMMEKHR